VLLYALMDVTVAASPPSASIFPEIVALPDA
jgi:hypothetical protein